MGDNIEQESFNLAIVVIGICGLSLLSLIFCLSCYFKFEVLQNQQFALISKVLIGDILYTLIQLVVTISYLIVGDSAEDLVYSNYPLCLIEASLSTFSTLFSVFWTSLICQALYYSAFNADNRNARKFEIVVGYILPVVLSTIPACFNGFGVSYPWPQTNCFFNAHLQFWEFDIFQSLFYYIPIWILFLYNLTVIIIVIRSLQSILKQQDIDNVTGLYQLFLYPGILAFCWVMPGIVGQFNLTTTSWLYSVEIISNLIGLLDSISYCYTQIFTVLKFENWRLVDRNEINARSHCTELIQTKTITN